MIKEPRYYVVDASNPELCKQIQHMSGYVIDNWSEENEPLDKDAEKFMKIAEKEGRVYSSIGFMVAFNIEQEISLNDWIYITDKY